MKVKVNSITRFGCSIEAAPFLAFRAKICERCDLFFSSLLSKRMACQVGQIGLTVFFLYVWQSGLKYTKIANNKHLLIFDHFFSMSALHFCSWYLLGRNSSSYYILWVAQSAQVYFGNNEMKNFCVWVQGCNELVMEHNVWVCTSIAAFCPHFLTI